MIILSVYRSIELRTKKILLLITSQKGLGELDFALCTPTSSVIPCNHLTQPQQNSTSTLYNHSWVRYKNDFAPHPTLPTTQTQCQQYLNCYLPNFDETLKASSWEHLQQIPTFKLTIVLGIFVHIRNISAVTDPMLMKL